MTTLQFSNLLEMHHQALLNFAKRLTQDMVDAEDLVQETALKAFKGRHTFRTGTSFKSWAFTILKNTFISKYHRRKRRAVVSKPVEDFSFAMKSSSAVRNDGISQLMMENIEKAISELGDTCAVPFMMHFEGYQYNEIADHLEIPIGTVKSRINYARKKLKEKLTRREIALA